MNTSKNLHGKTYTRYSDAQRAIKGIEKRENITFPRACINQLDNGVYEILLNNESKVDEQIKTLIIHPKDTSTEFLKSIYQNIPNKTIITEGYSKKQVIELIKSHDRVIMLGHGSPYGLFSMGCFSGTGGYIIDKDVVEYLKNKPDNIYVWCHAKIFVNDNNLNGFYSGMFISEVGEAYACLSRLESRETVDTSNNIFSKILGNYVNESMTNAYKKVVEEYSVLGETNSVARYNAERLYYR
jgi:hypothetical protein